MRIDGQISADIGSVLNFKPAPGRCSALTSLANAVRQFQDVAEHNCECVAKFRVRGGH